MSCEPRFVVAVGPKVSVQNAFIAAARAQKVAVPRDRADAAIVAVEGLDYFAFHCVPDLQGSGMSTHGEEMALLRPLNAGH